MEDARIIRSRQFPDDPDDGPRGGKGPSSIAVQTAKVATYPTVAGAFYAVKRLDVFGDEVEGGQATLTPAGATFYAVNLGSGIPPVGTPVIASHIDGRWAFRFDA